jgi:UDP-N-acetylmuramoyl-tripeptide--D-alanyl-D-alanine ligase
MLLLDSLTLSGAPISGDWWQPPPQPLRYTGIAYRSHDLKPGGLFVQPSPLAWGSSYDKDRRSLEELQRRGATTVILDRPPASAPAGLGIYLAADTSVALAELAIAARSASSAPRLCVTGSVGKSTTKRGIAALLAQLGVVHESQRNFNHYQGVLLTLAGLPRDADFAVLEFSSDAPPNTLPKALIAAPHLAVITDIQYDHTDCYPTLEAIADQKSLLFRGLQPGSTAVLNRDSPYYERLAAAAVSDGAAEVLSFGTSPLADVRLRSWGVAGEISRVEVLLRGRTLRYQLRLPGRHNVINSLAMLAAVSGLGLDPEPCLPALAQLESLRRHCLEQALPMDGGQLQLLDDSFSSNPASLRAALETLDLKAGAAPGRRLLVLGEIDELGQRSDALHAGLAEPILRYGIDRVFAHGRQTRHTCAALPSSCVAIQTEDAEALQRALMAELRPGDWLVLKFSRHSSLGPGLRDALRGLSAAAPANLPDGGQPQSGPGRGRRAGRARAARS